MAIAMKKHRVLTKKYLFVSFIKVFEPSFIWFLQNIEKTIYCYLLRKVWILMQESFEKSWPQENLTAINNLWSTFYGRELNRTLSANQEQEMDRKYFQHQSFFEIRLFYTVKTLDMAFCWTKTLNLIIGEILHCKLQ